MNITRRSALLSLGSAVLATPVLACRLGEPAGGEASLLDADIESFLRAVRAGDAPEVRRRLVVAPRLAMAKDAQGRSAFLIAHLDGRDEVAAVLQDTGLELDIVEAVFAEDWERLEALSKAQPELCNALHPVGGTPLYGAALAGSLSCWRLRSAGCRSNEAPEGGTGFTPARGAMDHRTVTGARIAATDILSNGGDPNAPQARGDSVLHGAVRRRSEILVRLAVRKGADVDARDDAGRTARELAHELGWESGASLLENHTALPRDNRASRFAFDANRRKIERPDLSDVDQKTQSHVTSNSHFKLAEVRKYVDKDPRLVFSISSDDELAIEASAHIGRHELMRYHLDNGSPFSLPTAVSLGDVEFAHFLLENDPLLIHERGAHDFPPMFYAVFGRGGADIAQVLVDHGASPDQQSMGTTALHWCVLREDRDFAAWLLEQGADIHAVALKWSKSGQTPLQLAREEERESMVKFLEDAGAKV